MSTARAQFRIFPHGSVHLDRADVEQFCQQLATTSAAAHMRGVALGGNASIQPTDGTVSHGALVEVHVGMPLSEARRVAGATLSGRVGMYELRSAPKSLTTIRATNAHMNDAHVCRDIDDYGEEYGTFSSNQPEGTPWVPKLQTGAPGSYNFVKLVRHSTDHNRFAVVASTSMTQAVNEAMDAAVAANPAITVGEYARSEQCARLYAAADLENERVAHRFGIAMGIEDSMHVSTHPIERTSNDEFATNVMYAKPTSMARWGEMRLSGDSTVRISNGVYDLKICNGSSVPVVRSPMHGIQAVSSARAKKLTAMPLDAAASERTLGALAVHPPVITPKGGARMGDAEMEEMQRVLHWPGTPDAATTMVVAANIAAHDVRSKALTLAHYRGLGHVDAQIDSYMTLGAVIDV